MRGSDPAALGLLFLRLTAHRRVPEVEDRTWNGRDIDHGLLDGAADHRDGGHKSDYEDPEASRRDMEARG